ncbi:HNH endonuclease [Nostoc sp.]|uniref:HNH endonuclease n=1 Tax=Nostoc sp. TaxID=1180 RepID=UPI002FF4D0BC
MTLRKQKGKCAECGLYFHPDDRVEIHHIYGNYRNRRKENLTAVHGHCHDRIHQGQGSPTAQISTHAKSQLAEEPDERKLSRTVL